MYGKPYLALTQNFEAGQHVVQRNEYNPKKIANVIRRYQELRSAAEITAVQYCKVSNGNDFTYGKDDILCMIVDIDQGVAALSSRQLSVVGLLKSGYQISEIGKILDLRPITVKFHIQQALFRLASYLNSSH